MKKRIFAVVIVVILATISYEIFSQSTPEGTATFVLGKNFWKAGSGSKWNPIKLGDKIPEGSSIRTGNGSRVTLIANGSEIKLAPNTELTLSQWPGGNRDSEINLIRGFSWYKLVNLGKKGFVVRTPTTTAGVRGTAFSAMYDPKSGESKNCICEGKVQISNDSSEKGLMLSAGAGVTAGRSKELKEDSYKLFISKLNSLPEFEAEIKKSPILSNCLSCHVPQGWDFKGVVRDEKYGTGK
jgi:hypothetical protein